MKGILTMEAHLTLYVKKDIAIALCVVSSGHLVLHLLQKYGL